MNDVFLTGHHIRCAPGDEPDTILARIFAGDRTFCRMHPALGIPVFRMSGAEDEAVPARRRALALLRDSAERAFGSDLPYFAKRVRTGLILGTTGGVQFDHTPYYDAVRRGFPPCGPVAEFTSGSLAEILAEEFGLTGPVMTVSNTCVSSADAVGTAAQWIRAGVCDAVLAAALDLATLMPCAGFLTLGAASAGPCRPFDRDRDGMNVGEGAGCLLLESADCLHGRNETARFRLRGYGAAGDAWHLTAPHPEGEGLTRAMSAALKEAAVRPDEIAFINAHGTGTRANDAAEVHAFSRVFGQVRYFSTKGVTGHALGASALLELVFTMHMLRERRIPASAGCATPDETLEFPPVMKEESVSGPLAMSTSLSFGGCNSALIVERMD